MDPATKVYEQARVTPSRSPRSRALLLFRPVPELPEVETLRRDLEREIAGRTIVRGEVFQERMIRGQTAATIGARLHGQPISAIERRGKFLFIRLGSGERLLIHRGMTGNLLLHGPSEEVRAHRHLSLDLDDDRLLTLYDPRGFGELRVLTEAETSELSARLGPEPLGPDFSSGYLAARWARRIAPVKALLLDQRTVAGLGNIYADECLWAARIHPSRPAGGLSADELMALTASVQAILAEAIEYRGTTFSDALDLHGVPGAYQDQLKVFHRAHCPRCGAPIVQLRVAGRGTSVCPRCQVSAIG